MLLSTGFRDYVLSTGSWKAALASSEIRIYSGTPPADADAAVTGTLLCTVKNAGAAINMDTASVGGVLPKAPGETWSGVNAASGTATYFRHVQAADGGGVSTSLRRIQGTVAVAGADLNISSVALVAAATQSIDAYAVVQPAA